MSLEGNKNRIHKGILDSLLRSQKRQSILDMRFARNKRAFGRAWDKTVERFGGRRGETTNPIIKGIMPDGSEAPGHRGRWKETETSNPRDTQWLQTYRQERSARLKRSDAVRSSIERIAAGVLAGTMALTGRGLLTPNVVNKAVMDKEQELRQSIDNKQRRDEMSLENTLREMLNEMKMPEKGEPDPTVHTGPKKPPFDPTVHSGPKDSEKYKRSLEAHKPKPKTLPKPHSPLKEHYKQRLDEKLDRSKVAGTLAQRTAREGHAAGIPASLVDLAAARARKQGTPDTRDHQYRVKRDEWWRGRRFGRGGLTPRERDVIGPDGVPDIRYTTAERLGLPTKAIGLMYSKIDAANTKEYGVSRRERGLKAEAETGYIAARRAASQARKRERGIAEHYEQD